jgi:acyl-CoA reductase-like NAD-dependent aldehyde dehydrogenase
MTVQAASHVTSLRLVDSTQAELDAKLATLQAKKLTWAQLSVVERIAVVDRLRVDLREIEERWVEAGMRAKGTHRESLGESEEWFTLTVTYRLLRYLRQTLVQIDRRGKPLLPGKVCWDRPGEWKVDVFPQNLQDRLALPLISAQVRLRDELKGDEPPRAEFYRQKNPPGHVCLVLGAGNIASQVTYDFLHKLFVEGQVVMLKMNPVNAYLAPLIEEGFRALVEPGYMQLGAGGTEVGAYLTNHADVDEIHLTGSFRTYEAVVFGRGEEGEKRKHERHPLIHKRFTAELGNVSPVIIVPGPWSQRDLRTQAAKIGSWLAPNAGFNCITPRVLIQHKAWNLRTTLNSQVSDYLKRIETRTAYYPGSQKMHDEFTSAHPDAQQLGQAKAGELPWTYITDLDPTDDEEICFRREAFIGLFAETALEAKDTVEFIENAVKFANSQLWGTLCASIVVHPKSLKNPLVKAAVEQAITDLNYGSVVINHWGALAYYMTVTPWGAPPGHDMYDIQSGLGKINNPLMFDAPIKSVLRAPFISIPDPYMAHSKTSYRYFRQDTRYQANPTWLNLAKLLWTALRS